MRLCISCTSLIILQNCHTLQASEGCCEPHADTVAPIFGPKGKLYTPINSFTDTGSFINQYTGGYRAYSVDDSKYTLGSPIINHTAHFETIVPPNSFGGPLAAPFYSTFGRTDPGTFEYQCLV